LRDADNPWYELILIEGRNREIRKMFEEVGHHVEKIRRVGYGPLILDLEPGRSRELSPEEVTALQRAAQGKSTRAAKVDLPTRKMPRPGRTRPTRPNDRPTSPASRSESRPPRPARRRTGR
jgi:23S rRNA pseudouridine2605 synthase